MIQITRFTIAALLAIAAICGTAQAETSFTYQGRLGNAAVPAEGQHDFAFRLFDAEAAGTQIGADLNYSPVLVSNGIFTVQLDFGEAPFNSNPRWLEIAVRETGSGSYTTLSPRQRIGASPFAIETIFVGPGAVDTAALQDNSVTTNKIANGNVFTDDLANFAVATGKLSNQAVTRLKIADDSIGTSQIEDGTVASTDIRDGTVAGVDIAENTIDGSHVADGGGLLHRKSEMQRIQGNSVNVAGQNAVDAFASCSDANDIAISHECEVITTLHNMEMRYVQKLNWTSESAAASVTCGFKNNSTALGADVRASIYCLNVP